MTTKKTANKKIKSSPKKRGCLHKLRNYIIVSLIMLLLGGAGEKYQSQIMQFAKSAYNNFSISEVTKSFNSSSDKSSDRNIQSQNIHSTEAVKSTDSSKKYIIKHKYYTLQYNNETEQPDWVAYKVTKNMIISGNVKRTDDFRVDPWVPGGSATPQDYYKSGYDKGHLCPAADMAFSQEAMSETFYMSNMSPQKPEFNRGGWKKLEEKERKWAVEDGVIFIVDGPIFYKDKIHKEIGSNKVGVPDAYFKVILDNEEPDLKGIGFIMPNSKISEPLKYYSVSIDDVEKLTGFNFFSNLSEDVQNKIESRANYDEWN